LFQAISYNILKGLVDVCWHRTEDWSKVYVEPWPVFQVFMFNCVLIMLKMLYKRILICVTPRNDGWLLLAFGTSSG